MLGERFKLDAAEVSSWLISGYILLITAGFVALRQPAVMPRGNQLSPDRAMFSAVNAGTLCGFRPTIGIAQSYALGKTTGFVLIVGGSLITLIVGGLAIKRVVGFDYEDSDIIRAALLLELGAIVVGGCALLTPARQIFTSAYQAAAAFGNAGAIFGPLSSPQDWRPHLVLMPLALLGSLGVPVLLNLRDAIFKHHALHPFTKLALGLTAGAYLLGWIVMLAVRVPDHAIGIGAWIDAAVDASVAANNARLTGLPYNWTGAWPRAAQWAVMVLMLVGGISGGLAGGIKLNTFVELSAGVRRSLRGGVAGRLFAIAALWACGYLLLIFITLLLLTFFQPEIPVDQLLLLAVSAAGNVGLSHDTVSATGPTLYVLSAAMLAGRIVPLLLLWWTAKTVTHAGNAVG